VAALASTERVIDLTPAVLERVENRGGTVALIFPRQACYSDAVGDAPLRIPYFACELQVEAATIESMPTSFPVAAEEWQLQFNGGSRASLLPVDFQAEGPVRLTFGDDSTNRLVVTGKRVGFTVGEKVDEEQSWAAT
jgi:hypothetical protein